jgi:predicted dehydrogenase
VRGSVHTLHSHVAPHGHAMSQLQVTGARGAAVVKLGVNLRYPRGEPDELALWRGLGPWRRVRLRGSWFPDAFHGPMRNLQRYAAGEDDVLVTRVDDALCTMALVEACYRSSAAPRTPIPRT